MDDTKPVLGKVAWPVNRDPHAVVKVLAAAPIDVDVCDADAAHPLAAVDTQMLRLDGPLRRLAEEIDCQHCLILADLQIVESIELRLARHLASRPVILAMQRVVLCFHGARPRVKVSLRRPPVRFSE
ncbi:hypothetical protein D3C76_1596790 [compost metagenome]